MSSPLSPFIKVRKPGHRVTLVRRDVFTADELETFEKSPLDGVYTLPVSSPPVSPASGASSACVLSSETQVSKAMPEKREKGVQSELDPDLALATALKRIHISSFQNQLLKGHVDDKARMVVANAIEGLLNIKKQLGPYAKGTVFSNISSLAAAICGVSEHVINRIRTDPPTLADIDQEKKVKSQKEKNAEAVKHLPYGIEQALKVEMQEWWRSEENVTLLSIQEWMKDEFGHELSRPTIAKILHSLGYSFRVKTHNPLINTKDFVVQWKFRYVSRITECRAQNHYIAYFDETWLFSGMNPVRGWAYVNCDPYSIVAKNGVTNVTPGPVKGNQKGQRAIVLAVSTEQGILGGSAQVLISGEKVENQTMDYHRMMNTDSFEEYMALVLPLLRDEAVQLGRKPILVIDNASYHCRPLQKLPTSASKKAVLAEFLRSKNQLVAAVEKKCDLWERVSKWINDNGGRKALTTYWIDQFASNMGVELVRLPPYHCELNPIELVWNQLKVHLRSVGKSKDPLLLVRERAMQWLNDYKAETARKTVEHVITKEREISQNQSVTSTDLAVDTLIQEVDKELGDDFESPDTVIGNSDIDPEDLANREFDDLTPFD